MLSEARPNNKNHRSVYIAIVSATHDSLLNDASFLREARAHLDSLNPDVEALAGCTWHPGDSLSTCPEVTSLLLSMRVEIVALCREHLGQTIGFVAGAVQEGIDLVASTLANRLVLEVVERARQLGAPPVETFAELIERAMLCAAAGEFESASQYVFDAKRTASTPAQRREAGHTADYVDYMHEARQPGKRGGVDVVGELICAAMSYAENGDPDSAEKGRRLLEKAGMEKEASDVERFEDACDQFDKVIASHCIQLEEVSLSSARNRH